MGHNSVISGHPKPTGISRVDGLSTRPQVWGVIVRLSQLHNTLINQVLNSMY